MARREVMTAAEVQTCFRVLGPTRKADRQIGHSCGHAPRRDFCADLGRDDVDLRQYPAAGLPGRDRQPEDGAVLSQGGSFRGAFARDRRLAEVWLHRQPPMRGSFRRSV